MKPRLFNWNVQRLLTASDSEATFGDNFCYFLPPSDGVLAKWCFETLSIANLLLQQKIRAQLARPDCNI